MTRTKKDNEVEKKIKLLQIAISDIDDERAKAIATGEPAKHIRQLEDLHKLAQEKLADYLIDTKHAPLRENPNVAKTDLKSNQAIIELINKHFDSMPLLQILKSSPQKQNEFIASLKPDQKIEVSEAVKYLHQELGSAVLMIMHNDKPSAAKPSESTSKLVEKMTTTINNLVEFQHKLTNPDHQIKNEPVRSKPGP